MHHPIFFGPGQGNPATHRFDNMSGQFGVLHVGFGVEAAVVETLLRNPQRRIVSEADLKARALTELSCRRELRVVRLYGSGLQQVGTDDRISTGPYDPCGLWSDALWDHPEQPDGITYRSRHDPDELCLALFERPGLTFDARPAVPLTDSLLSRIAAVLDRYGKSVSPD
jgi:hypothetical protein